VTRLVGVLPNTTNICLSMGKHADGNILHNRPKICKGTITVVARIGLSPTEGLWKSFREIEIIKNAESRPEIQNKATLQPIY